MAFLKINTNTWVLDNGKNAVITREKKKLADFKNSGENYLKQKKYRNRQEQLKLYEAFVKEVFAERNFICSKEFNELIAQKINSNATHYRKRLIALNLITEKNFIIKPVEKQVKKH